MQRILLSALLSAVAAMNILAQTTAFSYQGSLLSGGNPANGNFDFEFKLFDALSAGTQQGSTLQRLNIAVANGVFAVSLDFGAVTLPGANRYLEIGVRAAGGGGFTLLSPRQPVASSPYSVKSLTADSATNAVNATNAATATNSLQLGGVTANQYVLTTDPRMSDPRPPTAGSGNYIQNQNAAPQSAGNFNISGTGTGNIINAVTQFNLGGSRILGAAGTNNLLAGIGAGAANTGAQNAFFGRAAGQSNLSGAQNSFFGFQAGTSNLLGGANAFFGSQSGNNNTQGNNNSFFGFFSGGLTTTGNNNTFVGDTAGLTNTTGSNNTILGAAANVGANNLTFATAIGAGATVSTSNIIALGRSNGNDTVLVPGNLNVAGAGSALILNATTQYNIGGSRVLSNAGTENIFVGIGSGSSNLGSANSFFGNNAGSVNVSGSNNTTIGNGANVASSNLSNATAIGAGAIVPSGNTIQLGRDSMDRVRIGDLASATSTQLCITANSFLAACSSSVRYKENIQPFSSGLNLVRRLNPVTFDWKESKESDLGLIAEDVAEIEPLLVTHNSKGEVEGVKYDRVGVVLINAVNEQQAQIEVLGSQNQALLEKVERQQLVIDELKKKTAELDELKAYICRQNPGVQICKP